MNFDDNICVMINTLSHYETREYKQELTLMHDHEYLSNH